MSEKVIEFPGGDCRVAGRSPRTRNIEPRAVVDGAVEFVENLDQILIIGVTHEGKLYAASSHNDLADNIILMDRLRRRFLGTFGDDEFA